MPMTFTEHGVLMLASVLNSERAVQINIQIVRIFIRLRELLATHKEILQKLEKLERKDLEQDNKIMLIFDYIRQFEQLKQKELDQENRPRIGYKPTME